MNYYCMIIGTTKVYNNMRNEKHDNVNTNDDVDNRTTQHINDCGFSAGKDCEWLECHKQTCKTRDEVEQWRWRKSCRARVEWFGRR